MSIRVVCPSCAKVYNLGENMARKAVRCRECQTILTVSSASPAPPESEEPRRGSDDRLALSREAGSPLQPRRDERDEPFRRQPGTERYRDQEEAPRRSLARDRGRDREVARGGSNLPALLLIGGVALLLIGGVVAGVVLALGGKGGEQSSAASQPASGSGVAPGPANPGQGTAPIPTGKPGHEIRRFTGHSGAVFGVAFSPDGRRAVSGGRDRTVRLWDVGRGRELHRFEGHTGQIMSVAYSSDGRFAASAAEDGTVRLWDVQNLRPGHVLQGHQRAVQCVVFSSDGARVVSGSLDDTVRIWNVRDGQQEKRLVSSQKGIDSVAISPDGRLIASGGRGTGVRWSNTATGQATVMGFRGWVLCLAVSQDGRSLLAGTGSGDDSLFVMGVEGSNVRKMQVGVVGFFCATFTPDGRRALAGGFDQTFRLCDVSNGRELHRFTGHSGPVRSVSVSPDGRFALSASEDGTVRLWEMPN